jgi:poly(A) polymerase
MLKRFIKAITGAADSQPELTVIPRDKHNISRKHISKAALTVMRELHQAGYQGLLVGGGVRDLLLGGRPKDFDVATDATPEQVVKLFRNARVIGRRFKIVHVRFGREIIEVTTFRGSHSAQVAPKGKRPGDRKSAKTENGMLLRDNVYGTLEEDAIRRDFTINALYYTTQGFEIHDYTHGLKDLHNKTLRIIGDAETRYREDPVRMLRAIRFAAKLNFEIEPATATPINSLAPTLQNIPAARLFDEVLKLLLSGCGAATLSLLQRYNLFAQLFPETADVLANGDDFGSTLITQALINTDQRVNRDQPVTPAFLFAALLWPAVQRRHHELMAEGMPEVPALARASQEVANRQQQHISIPKRFGYPMREIWELQIRLPKRSGRRAENLLQNRRFRAAYDFLLLREQAGENTGGLGQWWTDYQNRSEEERDTMVRNLRSPSDQPRRHRRKRKPNEQ